MNKKLLSFLLMMLPTLLLTSCLKDQSDTFSESSSERVTNYLSKTKTVLTSAENGWVLDMFPDREQAYGGYSFTMKFDESNVEVCTELTDDVTETITTTYTLDNEDGPCLVFDTYNDFLHLFSTPSGKSGDGGYEAYDGDFVFIIMGISEDQNTITLKGNRSGNILYMRRISESIVEYQEQLAAFVGDLVFDKASAEIDGAEYLMSIDMAGRYMTFETPEGEETEVAFCFDNDGFSLYEPVTIGGKEVRVFNYDENEGSFTAEEDNSVVFKGLLLPSIAINNIGEEIILGFGANTLEYEFNLADKFTYTPNVDWITVSVEGKNVTINVAENTTGVERSGEITVEVDGQEETITITQMPINGMFINSETYVAISNVSEAAKPYFMACKALSDSEKENIGVMVFANIGDPYGFGLYFTSSDYRGLIALDTELIGSDEIKFTYNADNNYSSGAWYYNNGYKTLIDYMAGTTFKITADDDNNPTYYILTDKADATKYFKLTIEEVSNPFTK